MAISQFFGTSYVGNVATFNTMFGSLSGAMTQVGFLKTADTGQIDFTTNTAYNVGSGNGYEIRKFKDDAGNPTFFKIIFGNSGNVPVFSMGVGHSTDGAGNLTGTTWNSPWMSGNQNSATYQCFVCSDGNHLTIGLFLTSNAIYPQMISLGRTKDDSGNDTSDGTNVVWSSFGSKGQAFVPKAGGGIAFQIDGTYHCSAPPFGTGSYGTRLGLFPVFVSRGAPDNPDMGSIVVFNADMGNGAAIGSTITTNFYQTPHTFIYWGSNNGYVNSNPNIIGLALRYE